jgi:hypothetical protein
MTSIRLITRDGNFGHDLIEEESARKSSSPHSVIYKYDGGYALRLWEYSIFITPSIYSFVSLYHNGLLQPCYHYVF